MLGVWRGFVREVMSFAVWAGSVWLAWVYASGLAERFSGFIESPMLRLGLAGFGLFAAGLFLGGLATRLGSNFVHQNGLGDMDRVFGMLFGLLRGFLVVLVGVKLISYTPLAGEVWWEGSWILPHLLLLADGGLEQLEQLE